MSYSDTLLKIQEMRKALRIAEEAAERQAKSLRPLTAADEYLMNDMQARADGAYRAAARQAPPAHPYERPAEYERRLVSALQSLSPQWAKADVNAMPDEAFAVARDQVYADALVNGKKADLPPGRLRERLVRNESGHTVREFDGDESVWFGKQFARPAPRAVLKTSNEYAQMSRDVNMARINEIVRSRPIPSPMRTGF